LITYFFRKPQPGAHSIEELFKSIQKALTADLLYKNHYLSKTGAKPQVLLANGREAAVYQSQVNHITGDVHYVAPFLPKERTILTIHDLRPLFRGSLLKRKLIKWVWFSIPARSVRYITVISQATKEELLKEVGLQPEKVRVIPNCVSPQFSYSPKEFTKEQTRILHLGTKENKNLEGLIQALSGLGCHLRIIGKLTAEQQLLVEKSGIDYSNSFNLSFEEVVEEYRLADIVSFVSFYEGFGLPIIEAQATGRPVITSNVSSMPEVAGEGALLVNPYQTEEIREGIKRLLEDATLRQELVEKGLENVKRFQPQVIAARYAQLYREILGEKEKIS
jgi:glycosyltransferase involved in cell wall biosynthesis